MSTFNAAGGCGYILSECDLLGSSTTTARFNTNGRRPRFGTFHLYLGWRDTPRAHGVVKCQDKGRDRTSHLGIPPVSKIFFCSIIHTCMPANKIPGECRP